MEGDDIESGGTFVIKQPAADPAPSYQDITPGTVLKERYLIQREIGRGGIGIVFLACNQQLLSRRVAIKILQRTDEDTEDGRWTQKKFLHEMEALARRDHPGIVNLYDTGVLPDSKLFIVMQFLEGVPLWSVGRRSA